MVIGDLMKSVFSTPDLYLEKVIIITKFLLKEKIFMKYS